MIHKVILKLIRWYQLFVSPLFLPACRFAPCCSDYSRIAIEWHGLVRGGAMTLWRLLRCHPFARGGFDAVKENKR